ncbi:MAG: 5-formyltetrahydrofolate cyclo-ligase [Gammaproteobacteria bacterium]|nr:5-formyltetrahydrofolate cyclo-ligase [Gammaproteobacteria bacterium]
MLSPDELRQRNRKLRAELDENQLAIAAEKLCRRILALDEYQRASRIAAYFAVNGEIDLSPLIDLALAAGKQIFLPNLDQQALRFSPYFHAQKMRINRFRLPEPDVGDDAMLAPAELDLVLAPLVVFDAERNRIGMGGGFYDRSFEFRKQTESTFPTLVGVAHELQKVDKLIPEAWDVRLDMVVTDAALYR